MALTQTSLFVLLSMLTILRAAHAEDSGEIGLHNDDALADLSVVRNWTLICEQLCSLNLSGPACGLECPSADIPVDHQQTEAETKQEYNFSSDHRSELCETLCENGLGGKRCDCSVNILPAAFSLHFDSGRSARDKLCSNICRYHHFTLLGCSQCPLQNYLFQPLRSHEGHIPSSPTPPSTDTNGVKRTNSFSVSMAPFDLAETNQAATDPTTPDWNRLCINWCRQGTGGILCNCDLAPF